MTISEKAKLTTERLEKFMDKHVYPNNSTSVSYTHLTLPTICSV